MSRIVNTPQVPPTVSSQPAQKHAEATVSQATETTQKSSSALKTQDTLATYTVKKGDTILLKGVL